MTDPKLKVEKRKILGRKVKNLRREGILPANIYGKKIKSQAVKVDLKKFKKIYEEAGKTGIVKLVLGKGKARSVLVHNVQTHPVSGDFLHADFHQVVLTEKIVKEIPIELTGKSPAVEEKKGTLLTILDELEVEALPKDLPDTIEVDISDLAEVDQEIKVGDLKPGKKVAILTNPNLIVVKIGSLVTKEAEELAEKEAAMAEAAKEEVAEKVPEEEAPKEAPPEKAVPEKEAKEKPAEKKEAKEKSQE